jgi:hypothetical protein
MRLVKAVVEIDNSRWSGGSVERKRVSGWKVLGEPDSDPDRIAPLFLHRSINANGWSVTDPRTGLAFLNCMPTKKAAVALMQDMVVLLKRHMKRNGMRAGA